MKHKKTFVALLVLALLSSSALMMTRRPTRAAESQTGTAPHEVEPQSDAKEANLTNPTPWRVDEFVASSGRPSDVSSAFSATQSNSNWRIECVDCPKEFGVIAERGLRLDTNGHPHLAYGGDHLYYAFHDGTVWHIDTVDYTAHVGARASLTLDQSGYPHISYFGGYSYTGYPTAADLKYAYKDAMGWHIETVEGGRIGYNISLELDQQGYPHIGYTNDEILKYAYQDATGWHIETVDDQGEFGSSSLALDGNDYPHISYRDSENNVLYAYRYASNWQIEILNSGADAGSHTSLALDEEGHPHISYDTGGLYYAFKDTTGWHFERVPYLCDGQPSLALDGDHNPHISFEVVDLLLYAYKDAQGWHIEQLDTWGDYGHTYSSLAVDEQDEPHIGYFEHTDHSLNYLHRSAAGWHGEIVDRGGYVDSYASLALDQEGYPHISYRFMSDVWNNHLKYAYQNATGWHIQTIESGKTGYYPSLALDETSFPHVSYYDNFRLKYAYRDLTDWHIEIVDVGDLFGSTSLALDESGYPHIGYAHWTLLYCSLSYCYYDADLRHAHLDATGWHTWTVDSGYASNALSLMLDSNDYPHISYYADHELKYARYDGTAWQIDTVPGEQGNDISLALSEADQPHISYYDPFDRNLKYTRYDGIAWYTETVDSEENVGQYNSLALDKKGRPHISYGDSSNYDLKYAWYDGTVWRIDTVDSADRVGADSSLALDGKDRPSISYVDVTLGDLKYALLAPVPLSLDIFAIPNDGLHNNQPLTYTLTLSGSGLDARLWDSLPPSVVYISGSLTGTVTPTAVYSPTAHAITWQGTLPTDTVGLVRFQVTPGLTGTGSLSLSAPIVNTAWLTDTMYNRTVSATVIVNGWHAYLPLMLCNP